MLALRQDQRLFPFFHPDPPQLGMKTKPCFIRKKQEPFPLTSLDRQEFFLRSSETPPPRPSWPEHNGKSVAAKKTLTAESIAELGAPSIEPHESAPDTPPPPPHPTGFASNPMPWGSFLSPPPKPSESARQDGKDARVVSSPLRPQPPSRLLPWIHLTTLQRVRPKSLAICDDFQPSKSRRRAAIRMPIQAPGIFSAISNRASRVTDLFVIVNAFMASLPKKVFECFSEGIIR